MEVPLLEKVEGLMKWAVYIIFTFEPGYRMDATLKAKREGILDEPFFSFAMWVLEKQKQIEDYLGGNGR